MVDEAEGPETCTSRQIALVSHGCSSGTGNQAQLAIVALVTSGPRARGLLLLVPLAQLVLHSQASMGLLHTHASRRTPQIAYDPKYGVSVLSLARPPSSG